MADVVMSIRVTETHGDTSQPSGAKLALSLSRASTRGRGEVLGQAGVAKASAYHLNRNIEESKK